MLNVKIEMKGVFISIKVIYNIFFFQLKGIY